MKGVFGDWCLGYTALIPSARRMVKVRQPMPHASESAISVGAPSKREEAEATHSNATNTVTCNVETC